MNHRFFNPLLLFIILISCSNVSDNDLNDLNDELITFPREFNISHNSLNRKYIFYKPKNLAENSPLVFVLHGYTSNSSNIMNYSKMNSIAEENGFAVCYPQGTNNSLTGASHWNANLKPMSSVKDSSFLTELAKHLQDEYDLSTKNTFACGMSNGGFMSYTLACEQSETFKAIASITGTMSGYDWQNCNPNHKIPVLQISGTNDRTVPMDGSMSPTWGWGGAPDIENIIDYWSEINECSNSKIIDLPDISSQDNSFVTLDKRFNLESKDRVRLYTVHGGGHDWPGAWGNMDIDASEEIWDFFSKHLK